MSTLMNLKILLPYATFIERSDVLRIVAETNQGSFGILPNRLDCTAVLAAGVFCYQCLNEKEVFIAVDQGILVKTGAEVMISVRRAVGHADLDQLQALVKQEFLRLDEQEQRIQTTRMKLETGFLRQLTHFQHQ